jgi:hypothetical protein
MTARHQYVLLQASTYAAVRRVRGRCDGSIEVRPKLEARGS